MGYNTVLVKEQPRGPSQFVEVLVTANGTFRQPFPDVQQLRSQANQNIIITGIRLITTDALTNAVVSGLAVAPATELRKCSLVLYCEGWEKAQYIPLIVLNDVATPAGTIGYRNTETTFSDWQNVDWSKSYIQYSNGTGGSAGQPYAFCFDVEYVKMDGGNPAMNIPPQEIIGPS